MTQNLATLAATLRDLHRPGDPVVLPTVWDAWSATFAVEAGFSGLTVGSHPVADAIGKEDGEHMSFADLLHQVRLVTGAVDVPVSVDVESGYGLSAPTLIGGLLDAGAVGLNIEDTVHSEGGRLREPQEHADLIARLRQAADAAEVPFVINARTDLFKRGEGEESDRVDRAIERMRLCAEAGASSLYPVSFHDEETLTRICSELPLPVNGLAFPEKSDLDMYRRAGCGRISFGPLLQMALGKVAGEHLARWR